MTDISATDKPYPPCFECGSPTFKPSPERGPVCLMCNPELRTLRSVEPPPDAINLLRLILPLAKGYAHEHPVGSNRQYVNDAEEFLAVQEEVK